MATPLNLRSMQLTPNRPSASIAALSPAPRTVTTPLRSTRNLPVNSVVSVSSKSRLAPLHATPGAEEHRQADLYTLSECINPSHADHLPILSPRGDADIDVDVDPHTPPPRSIESATIDDWTQYAKQLDLQSAAASTAASQLDRAVILEDYSAAAKVKADLEALRSDDVLAEVIRQQRAAVAADDYATAASLRDASLQTLTGWWAASNVGADPWSHVVRVTEGYSRLDCRAFSPVHLAAVMGWGNETPYHRPFGNKSFDDAGVPFFEVLLRRDDAGNLMQRHFVLPDQLPTDEQLKQSIMGPTPSPPSPPPPAFSMPVPLPQVDPLTSTASPTETQQPKPPLSLWSMLMNRSSTDAAASVDPAGPSDAQTADPAISASAETRAAQSQSQASPTGGPDGDDVVPSMSGVDDSTSSSAVNGWWGNGVTGQLTPREQLQPSLSVREAYEKLEEMDALAALSELEERTALPHASEASPSTPDTSRLPCGLTLIDRNHFRLTLPPLPGGSGAPRVIDYVRLEANLPSSDPLTGYYLGSFGVHGPELLLLQRGIWEGEEAVIAHKVTGDPNVPSGQVSFRAKVGAKHGLRVSAYPSHLSVSQRFAGEGCVAERGFVNARWAKGELLSFGAAGSGKFKRLTGNAELGFIWSMAHSKRFLILLSRVNFN